MTRQERDTRHAQAVLAAFDARPGATLEAARAAQDCQALLEHYARAGFQASALALVNVWTRRLVKAAQEEGKHIARARDLEAQARPVPGRPSPGPARQSWSPSEIAAQTARNRARLEGETRARCQARLEHAQGLLARATIQPETLEESA